MANITVSSSSNFDAAGNLGLANGENITINTGARLTVDSDNRWSQNAACPTNITIDSASGGELFLEGRNVWWVPFDASTGMVPALGSYGTQNVTRGGSSVGEFLGVWTALGVSPSASGGAMPSSGWIKLRSKSAVLADNDVLTIGTCTVTLSGAGQRGWLHFVGVENGLLTVPNLGSWTARGDWFDLGVTSGSRDQTLQYYVADYCPALWIETSPGSGTYEIWAAAGDRWSATYVSTDERGRFFGCTAAGVITLAATGYGKLPAAGCKIRVPNIHVSSTTSVSSYASNTLNTTMSTRWEVSTTALGNIDIDKMASSGFYWNIRSCAYAKLIDFSCLHQIYFEANAFPFELRRVAVGLAGATDVSALYTNIANVGGLVEDSFFAKYAASTGTNGACWFGSSNTTVLRNTVVGFARANTDGYTISVDAGTYNNYFEDNTLIGAYARIAAGAKDCTIKNTLYSDTTVGGLSTAQAQNAVFVSSCANIVVDGLTLLPNGTPPYNAVIRSLASDSKFRNIGTPAAPFDCQGHSAYAIDIGGGGNVKFQRIYAPNTRTGLEIIGVGSPQIGVTHENVWGSAGSTLAVGFKDSSIKGMYGGSATWPVSISTGTNIGTHFYDTFYSATAGKIGILFSAPSTSSAAYVSVENGAIFNGGGSLLLRSVGDRVTYTWPHFILGYTSLANVAPTLNGVGTGNLTIEYDLDKGSGFSGTWKTCTAANLSAETGISATTGFKPKFRFTCATAASTNSIAGFYITGTTDATSQQTQYPLDVNTLTITGLPVGVEVRAYVGAKDGSAVEVGGTESTTSTSFSFPHSVGGQTGFIVVVSTAYKIIDIDYTYEAQDVTLPLQVVVEPWYSNP